MGEGFWEQRLAINDGHVLYTGHDNSTAKIWVDVFNPVIHVEVDSPQPISVNLAYENWRYKDRQMVGEERNQGSWGIYTSKVPNGTTYADAIDFHKGGVLMSHRNEKLDLWNFQLAQQGLQEYEDKLYNPMRNNEVRYLLLGLWYPGTNSTRVRPLGAIPRTAAREHHVGTLRQHNIQGLEPGGAHASELV